MRPYSHALSHGIGPVRIQFQLIEWSRIGGIWPAKGAGMFCQGLRMSLAQGACYCGMRACDGRNIIPSQEESEPTSELEGAL